MEIVFHHVSCRNRLVNINYEFEPGKITCILGKSGSGKSLVGALIMGLKSASEGYISIDGERKYDLRKIRKEIGYVYQNPMDHIFCDTVYEEVCFGLKQYRFKEGKQEEHVCRALKMVGLGEEYLKMNPRVLSSGEIERIAIASSLVLNPKVLILDEPTVYLDNKVIREFNQLLKMLRDKYHKTIIVMSNDMDNISEICDNFLLLDEGKMIQSGCSEEILSCSEMFLNYGMEVSDIVRFVQLSNSKGISLSYTNDIEKLVQDVVDHVS